MSSVWDCISLHVCNFDVCVVDYLISDSVCISFVFALLDFLRVSVMLVIGLLVQSGVVQ